MGATAANGSFTATNGDYLCLLNTGGAVDYAIVNDTDIDIDGGTYDYCLYRYKTGTAAVRAQIILEDENTVTQTVLSESSSVTWVTAATAITLTDQIDHIYLYANDVANYVWYDFILLCKGTFTLPNTAFGMNIDFPPREVVLPIPGKDTDAIQNLGTQSAVVNIGCDLTEGDWTRTGDTIDGEVFLDILHNRSSEPWQWLDTGSHQFKVTVHPQFSWDVISGSTIRRLDLTLREYSAGDKSEETYAERYGIGL